MDALGLSVEVPGPDGPVQKALTALTPGEVEAYAQAHPDEGPSWAYFLAGWAAARRHETLQDLAGEARDVIQRVGADPGQGWPIAARLLSWLRTEARHDGWRVVIRGTTYQVLTGEGLVGIRCFLCQGVSHHPQDIANRYCGPCQMWHDREGEEEMNGD